MGNYIIIAPCYNEEKALPSFLNELETIFNKTTHAFLVVIVDDCSTDASGEILRNFSFNSDGCKLEVVRLKYNMGHQKAIREGLKYASQRDADGYIVMDADGQDDPEAILKLIGLRDFDIVFINRGKRNESLAFKTGYLLYQLLFKIISGNKINFGNYSMVSKQVMDSISTQYFDHYSAFLSKLKFRKDFIRFDRRKRVNGNSKMNFNGLVMHGLKSLLEYSEELLFFFIRILSVIFFVFVLYGGYALYSYFFSHKAIPGWTSSILTGLVNSILITSGIIVLGLLIVSQRNRKPE